MRHVLIIDDDPGFRRILEKRLASFLGPIQVTPFPSLGEARSFLKEARTLSSAFEPTISFDLILVDEHLPDGRGTQFVAEGWFRDLAVLSVSSDDAPEVPGASIQAGASYFFAKSDVSLPIFQYLVLGIIERNKLQRELEKVRLETALMDTVKTLIRTLQHEINNPLGAVLGAAYLLRTGDSLTSDQKRAAELVESSGQRIKHVLEQLCQAVKLDSVSKGNQTVYHVPGDKPWEE